MLGITTASLVTMAFATRTTSARPRWPPSPGWASLPQLVVGLVVMALAVRSGHVASLGAPVELDEEHPESVV